MYDSLAEVLAVEIAEEAQLAEEEAAAARERRDGLGVAATATDAECEAAEVAAEDARLMKVKNEADAWVVEMKQQKAAQVRVRCCLLCIHAGD